MRRRYYLGLMGSTLLAGCGSDADSGGSGGSGGATTPEDTAADQGGDTPTPETTPEPTPTETETKTPTPTPSFDLVAKEMETVDIEKSYYSGIAAVGTIVNNGDGASGTVETVCDWLDSSGSFVASQTEYCKTIGAGETWLPLFDPSMAVDEPSKLDSAELAIASSGEAARFGPEGISLNDVTVRTSGEDALVRGAVTNNRSNSVSYLEAIAKFYDDQGRIIDTEYTNKTEFAAGSSWRFQLEPLITTRLETITDATVLLTTDAVL